MGRLSCSLFQSMWAGLWSAGSPAHLQNVGCHQLGLLRSCAADVWCGSIVSSTWLHGKCSECLYFRSIECLKILPCLYSSHQTASLPSTPFPWKNVFIWNQSFLLYLQPTCAQPTSNLQLLIISVLFFRRLYEHSASHHAPPPFCHCI